MTEENKNGWYVAIINMGSDYVYHFIGAGSSNYKDFKKISKNCGVSVLAEQFNVSDEICVRTSRGLEDLVRRIRAGEKFDIQKELTKLCAQKEF